MTSTIASSANGIHSGLHTHHQLHAIALQSFNTKNTTNSNPQKLMPPDDFVSILYYTLYSLRIFFSQFFMFNACP